MPVDIIHWWLMPITVIPGLGMLILSTSARYISVSEEMSELAAQPDPQCALAEALMKRANCLQQALFALYLALTLFAASGLVLAVFSQQAGHAFSIATIFMVTGVVLLTYSSGHLAFEVFMSRRILQNYRDKIISTAESHKI
jgi:hypothetical protein